MFGHGHFESIHSASKQPLAVRSLDLIRPGESEYESFCELIPTLKRVRRIKLGWQSWTSLPATLSGLPMLTSLSVLNMPIAEFPAFLATSPRLRELVLRGTDISVIPPAVQDFRHLRRFDFSNNPILEIPSELGRVTSLRELAIGDNDLRMLHDSLVELRRLQRLRLAGNRFSECEARRIQSMFRRGVVGNGVFNMKVCERNQH